jgi:hypothetical protein
MRRRTFGLGAVVSLFVLAGVTIAAFAGTRASTSEARPKVVPHRSPAPLKETVSALSAPRRNVDVLPPVVESAARALVADAGPDVPRELLPGDLQLDESRLLLDHLGPRNASFWAVPTATGNVCLFFAGGDDGCADSFAYSPVLWSVFDPDRLGSGEPFTVYGIAPDDVNRIEVAVDGVLQRALLKNNAFYYRLPDAGALPQRIVVSFADGTSETISLPDYSKL